MFGAAEDRPPAARASPPARSGKRRGPPTLRLSSHRLPKNGKRPPLKSRAPAETAARQLSETSPPTKGTRRPPLDCGPIVTAAVGSPQNISGVDEQLERLRKISQVGALGHFINHGPWATTRSAAPLIRYVLWRYSLAVFYGVRTESRALSRSTIQVFLDST
jgi:hypothetical protein